MREELLKVGTSLIRAREEKFTDHPIAKYIRSELRNSVQFSLGDFFLSIKASAGAGNWAAIPWVGVFDPIVTEGATTGYYVVYLFAPDRGELVLSLNQGATAVLQEYGSNGLSVLRTRADLMRARIADHVELFDQKVIELGSKLSLPRAYEAGHVFGRTYPIDDLPKESELVADLHRITRTYLALTFRGGLAPELDPLGSPKESEKQTELLEIRRYQMHLRIERNPRVGAEVKQFHGTICQACRFDFKIMYGAIGEGFIEAHHLRPLATLSEGETVAYNISTDFAVLCANCHRMIHRLDDPSNLAGLKLLLDR
ncbi:MrcB family domain-containing protein [Hyphomicrobium sp. 99]|uniref:MrcB family domain-containing protein n=1 Tax=Hyphomicrobium sp. 99 TaxID=1163419 RepID=UPI0006986F44|nr:DUF3578 domain-containing protein [Hyphomicrobium sp. 99]